ncbi:restriction endonuclease subunit S [uncultured Corynebacterium sp.]|uniref:restriction endonuclease subunit S n=1 Tax=uncultured Corynebacterium sp. TaxID=159447 RepID=UPI0025950C78|nr:restriction endonuclease subunit S [uncultured Corynebacterium sp.]
MSQWPMVKLGDVCTFSSGGTPNRKKPEFYSGAIPWISSADIDENGNISTRRYITDEAIQKSSAIVVPQGTLLLVTRTGVGKVAVSQYEVSFSQDITAIEINDQNIDKDYLVQTIRHFAAPRLLSKARGATILGVKRNDVANLEIPFPPLEEQRRIAEILKQSSQQISNARQKLDHLLMISLNTMDAHFTAEAVAGDRGWSQIGDFVISTQYGTSKKANETQGIPVLRMGNITYEGELDLKDLKYVELDELERKKFNLKNGDILFNRTNSPELVGKTTVYDSQSEMTFAGYLVRARTSEDAHPEYISVS